jgi:hypothetical protein
MKLHRTPHPSTCDKDISSKEFWAKPFDERDETFRWLRENAPVSWHPSLEDPALPASVHGEAGFWALTLAEDITFASRAVQLRTRSAVSAASCRGGTADGSVDSGAGPAAAHRVPEGA